MKSGTGEAVGVEPVMSSLGARDAVNGQDSSLDTTYHPYPPSRPFINTDYQRSASRPILSFPESNRDGVLSALRNLQKKMQRLEVERRDAEAEVNIVGSGLGAQRTTLWQDNHHTDTGRFARQNRDTTESGVGENGLAGIHSADNSRPRARALESQLSSAETRCQLLEKQLDYMRRMVQAAERDRVEAVHKAEVLQQHQDVQHDPSPFTPDYCAQLERIGELERDHLRLTATQTLAEMRQSAVPKSKIHELEKKLREERDHRKMLQERALDLETAAISHQLLLKSAPVPEGEPTAAAAKSKGKKSGGGKKKKKLVSRKQVPVKSEPTKHYRLNLADIPFVAGKSTGPSHAVGANVQKVLALMKSHNLALCSSLYNGHGHGEGGRSSSPSLSSSSSVSGDQDLTDLMTQLQDEFGQLSIEHQEYMRRIQETTDPGVRLDLERELEDLVLKMEAKSQQISIVRQHQQKQEETKQQARQPERVPRPNSAMGRLQASHKHVHAHTRDPHHHHHHHGRKISRPRSSTRGDRDQRQAEFAPPSLHMLRDMRKLQSTLRCDDLCWE